MGEDNGIKIKTNISYPIMSLFIVGLFAYFEVYGIKRIIVDVKNDNVTDILGMIFWILIIHLVYLFFVFDLINIGRKIKLTKEGCIISFLWIKRRYGWEVYQIKKLEQYSTCSSSWAPITPYDEGAVFSKVPVKRPKRYRPVDMRSYLTRYVFSTVWVCFQNEKCKKSMYASGYFEVDKEEFLQKMEEWGVELEQAE